MHGAQRADHVLGGHLDVVQPAVRQRDRAVPLVPCPERRFVVPVGLGIEPAARDQQHRVGRTAGEVTVAGHGVPDRAEETRNAGPSYSANAAVPETTSNTADTAIVPYAHSRIFECVNLGLYRLAGGFRD
jgi:hypothetical protein